jgi:hypothetical protein
MTKIITCAELRSRLLGETPAERGGVAKSWCHPPQQQPTHDALGYSGKIWDRGRGCENWPVPPSPTATFRGKVVRHPLGVPPTRGKFRPNGEGWRNHGATLPNCNPQVNPVPYPSGAPAYSGKSPAGGGVGGNWPYCAPEGPCRVRSGPASPENRSRRSAKSVVPDQEPPDPHLTYCN